MYSSNKVQYLDTCDDSLHSPSQLISILSPIASGGGIASGDGTCESLGWIECDTDDYGDNGSGGNSNDYGGNSNNDGGNENGGGNNNGGANRN